MVQNWLIIIEVHLSFSFNLQHRDIVSVLFDCTESVGGYERHEGNLADMERRVDVEGCVNWATNWR